MGATCSPEDRVTAAIRRLLIWTLLAGILGTGAELLLLAHFETAFQVAPLVLLGLGAAVVLWHLVTPRAASVRALQAVAVLLLAVGVVGVGLHYQGNEAFELEMYPERRGFEMIREAAAGATPVLAPGAMALLGLVAIAYTYRHPVRRGPHAGPHP